MTWFKVDDRFHSHPKAAAASLAALGLWVVAGSWCGDHLTDGNVPDHVLPLLSRGATELADELVSCGLWRRTKSGYRFHQWMDHNPTREEATTAKENQSSGGAIGNHRRWHVARGITDDKCRYCQRKQPSGTDRVPDRVGDGVPESHPNPPSRPDPTLRGNSGGDSSLSARARPEPPQKCPKHADDPAPPNCGPCADARRAHDRWQADQQRADQARRSAEARARAEAAAAAIRACRLCDQAGRLPSGVVCTHDPARVGNTGAAKARAAIRKDTP